MTRVKNEFEMLSKPNKSAKRERIIRMKTPPIKINGVPKSLLDKKWVYHSEIQE